MRAVSGYLENGRFTPHEVIKLPRRVQAVLVFNDATIDENKTERMAWLSKFHASVVDAADEEMPDFQRMQFNRELIDFFNEGR